MQREQEQNFLSSQLGLCALSRNGSRGAAEHSQLLELLQAEGAAALLCPSINAGETTQPIRGWWCSLRKRARKELWQ